MELKKIKIEQIKEAKYNPRKITKEELDKLKNSIKQFGYVEPIIVNKKTDNVVGGHQRLKALKELKQKEVDVIYIDIEENKEKALNLALNKITGDWDEEKLIDLLNDIETKEEELLKYTGFDEKEIEVLLDNVKNQFEDSKEDKITIEHIKQTKVQKGDVFLIDNKHRVICGDSTDPGDYKKLFGSAKADLIMTSPPYNAKIDYSEYSDNKKFEEYIDMINGVYKTMKDFLNKDRFICINVGDMTKLNLTAHHSIILEKLNYRYARTIYWIKPEGSARGVSRVPYPRWYRPKVNTESILIYLNKELEEMPKRLKVMLIYSDRKISGKDKPETRELKPISRELMKKYSTNVWKLSPETGLSSHPAPYPITLPNNCIKFYSLENELIFDPFLGSGTTIIAAEELGRKGYGIDIDPKYIELSLRRYKERNPKAEIKCLNRKVEINGI